MQITTEYLRSLTLKTCIIYCVFLCLYLKEDKKLLIEYLKDNASLLNPAEKLLGKFLISRDGMLISINQLYSTHRTYAFYVINIDLI